MKKFFNKAKEALDSHGSHGTTFPGQQQQQPQNQQPIQSDRPSSIQAPAQADVTRYRYHHGANLGSVFILERWLCGSMFPEHAQGSSELAAVTAWIHQEGPDKARERFERHWHEYVSDADLDWLRDAGHCTTVRLPIGYFSLGPPYCEGTPFQPVAAVYQNAWAAVKQLVQRCHQRGVGVLIDLHGLPGGANAQDHSGTNFGKAELWGSRRHQDLATRCLCFIAQEARGMDGVAGVQIINEAEGNARGMYEWYDHALKELSSIDPTMPVYISDAWDLNRAASWTQARNSLAAGNVSPVVVDTHLYWCFSDADKAKSPQQITQEVGGKLSELDGKDGSVVDHGAAQTIIGEYSCVLDGSTWDKSRGAPKEQLVRGFGNAESARFQQRAGGSFFWTYRMDWMPGGEWGFRQMTEQHAIVPPSSLTLPANDVQGRIQAAQQQLAQRKQDNVGAHCHYWDSNHPGQYEHWRYEQGWDVGYNDAMAFFGMRNQSGLQGGDKIGMLDLWCLKRLRESGQGGKFVWEFEQGLRQGVRSLYEAVGV
ncbi:glycoside hydrolase family 5 protein [Baudoinia panamericana UAMH 10762]|uniref:Glycoside hydrolase family 5 protein n=1 Tax=Baudoinia panamericana (strain UAMH 10762) TaxID=717646 RepID=M2NN64_BAUPA|nr:glycoside hydrolase family 5 protein [Baudoinia panamericana UAMH 10762]EMD00666.1 glycoside hydrolase family 5 protein [Baudoinia panamericana UAMH 10762]